MKIFSSVLKLCVCLGAVCVLSMVFLSFAHAEDSKKTDENSYTKPMPKYDPIPKEEFEEKTTLHMITPFDDPTLAFSVRLPKVWEAKPIDESVKNASFTNKIFGELSTFYGPFGTESGFPSRFEVTAVGLSYEMTAEQWLIQYLLTNGYTPQGFDVKSGTRAEALYVVLEKDISYIVRTAVVRNGKQVILAQYFMPIEFYPIDKSMQAEAINSFELANNQRDVIENMKSYHFLDIAVFQYPDSWELRDRPLRNVDNMKVEVLSKSKIDSQDDKFILNGKIEVALISVFQGEGLEGEIYNLKNNLGKTGLSLGDRIPFSDVVSTSELFDFVDTKVFQAIDQKNGLIDYELWMTVMAHNDYYYFMTLLTPARERDNYTWGRNVETYKLMLELIEPQINALIDE